MADKSSQVLHMAVNNRLAQTLKYQLVESELQHSKVVATPLVMTWNSWWKAWQQILLLRGELLAKDLPAKVLSDFESIVIWESLLKKSEQSALLNLSQTARQLHQAWLVFDEYQFESHLEAVFQTEELRLFLKLKKQYCRLLEEHNWWDSVTQMEHRLSWLKLGHLPEKVCLHGFDEIPPYLQRWCDVVGGEGTAIEQVLPEPHSAARQSLFVGKNPQDETQQAVGWALDQLEKIDKVQPRIAIVAPDIAEVAESLVQNLDAQLFQTKSQSLKTHQQSVKPSDYYNLSLGQSLLELPIVQNAMLTLKLFSSQKSVSFNDFSLWLNSAFSCGSLLERQQFDASFRRLQWPKFTLNALLDKAKSTDGFHLPSTVFRVINQKLPERVSSRLMTIYEFFQAVELVLARTEWAQSGASGGLSSQAFQQKQAFEQALLSFSSLRVTIEQQSFDNWLSLFQRFVAEQVHQPQSAKQAPIQILGMLEAGGQSYDAIWVMGLTAKAWPREAKPNPFLPVTLQRQLGAPRSDAQRELHYAQALTERLASSAPEIVWSGHLMKEGKPVLLSPLVEKRRHHLVDYVPNAITKLPNQLFRESASIIWVEDAMAPEVCLGDKVPGGAGILDAQRRCPLMAFFDYRLGARNELEDVEEGMPKNLLGTLVHEVLEHFWRQTESSSRLQTMDEAVLRSHLLALIDEAMISWQTHFNEHYLSLERNRILNLLVDWLALEKQRPAFKVVGFEEAFIVEMSGILFHLKLDRIDEVTGHKLILDYKTGKASAKDLLKEPLEAPQLAVYLHAVSDQIVGLGYGFLHSDEGVKFNTIVENDEVMIQDRSQTIFAKLSQKAGGAYEGIHWEDFLDRLRTEITEIASRIQQGEATVSFEKEEDLRFASSALALRLPEVKSQIG